MLTDFLQGAPQGQKTFVLSKVLTNRGTNHFSLSNGYFIETKTQKNASPMKKTLLVSRFFQVLRDAAGDDEHARCRLTAVNFYGTYAMRV